MYIADVKADLNRRMASYNHSMQPSDDEVALALLICHIDELEEKIDNAKNCLVCAVIADPMEICETTLDMLEHVPAGNKPNSNSVCGGMNACIGSYYDHTTTMCQECVKATRDTVEVTVEVMGTTNDCKNDNDTSSIHVSYWPDGTWCLAENLHEYDFMSDDYTVIELPDTTSEEDIESIVNERLK